MQIRGSGGAAVIASSDWVGWWWLSDEGWHRWWRAVTEPRDWGNDVRGGWPIGLMMSVEVAE